MKNNMNTYEYTVNGKEYKVEIEEIEGNKAKVNVNGRPFEVNMKNTLKSTAHNKPNRVEMPKVNATKTETAIQPTANIVEKQEIGAGAKVTSPLPGTVTEIIVKIGDTVKQGDTVLILEAMKMQNSIEADQSGTITSIMVKEGETVMEGAILVTIA